MREWFEKWWPVALCFTVAIFTLSTGTCVETKCEDSVPAALNGTCTHDDHQLVVEQGAVLCRCDGRGEM